MKHLTHPVIRLAGQITFLRFLLLLSISLIPSAWASDVPYVFSPNTPAKASEVNANFAAIASQQAALAAGAEVFSKSATQTAFSGVLSPVFATPGTKISVGSVSYTMVELPVFDAVRQKKYSVVYPVPINSQSGNYNAAYLQIRYAQRGGKPKSCSISGRDAWVEYTGLQTQVDSTQLDTSLPASAHYTTSFGASVTLRVSDNVEVQVFFTVSVGTATWTPNQWYNATANTPWTSLNVDIPASVSKMNTLIGYIRTYEVL
jgi:hypothetical protein